MLRTLTTFALTALLFASVAGDAHARENQTYAQGVSQCFNWCDVHNKTPKSRNSCYSGCIHYWLANGSDTVRAIN